MPHPSPEQLLAEIEEIIRSTPPRETIRHDTPESQDWLGRACSAMYLWDSNRALLFNQHAANVQHALDGNASRGIRGVQPIAIEAIKRIRALYEIERQVRGRQPAERRIVRQQLAGPLLDDLHGWLTHTLHTVSMKSALAEAIQYSLSRWVALTRYRDDGRIEIDNNTAERAIRPVVLGRKNYLFAGSDAGGERAANIYSLIGTCLLNSIEPYRYLRDLLERIPEHPVNRIEELLPWNLATKAQEAQRLAA